MIHRMQQTAAEKIITLTDDIVYGHRMEWCGSVWHPLKMSLMRPRQHFSYDEPVVLPAIVWLCGGGFTEMDRNVWIPELTWFAKRGYVVACVEYSVTARTRFPMQLEDIKLAIRWLRAHAAEIGIDPERIFVGGESAGGYLSALTGLTGERRAYDRGEYLNYSSAVKGVIAFYPCTVMSEIEMEPEQTVFPPDTHRYTDLPGLVDENTPPFLLLHGTKDSQVPISHSERLYEALESKGKRAEFYIFEGAEHADAPFYQESTKKRILDFMNSLL